MTQTLFTYYYVNFIYVLYFYFLVIKPYDRTTISRERYEKNYTKIYETMA